MTLEDAIEITENYRYTICCGEHVEDGIRELLLELQDLRSAELRPATKFLGNTKYQQYGHISEEYIEVANSLEDEQHLIEELIDLQMSCETMLAILGFDEEARRGLCRQVIAKNEARGYYKE